jgi:hypothetical protein
MRDIAVKFNILFILVNGTSTNFARNLENENKQIDPYFDWLPKQQSVVPALGKYFPYCCDEVFRFEKKIQDQIFTVESESQTHTKILFYVERSSEIKPEVFYLGIDKDGVKLLSEH